jgi:hypothetical protein
VLIELFVCQVRKTRQYRLDPAWAMGDQTVSPAISAETVDLPAMFVHACSDRGCDPGKRGAHADDQNFYLCESKHGFAPEEVFQPQFSAV